MNGAIRTGETYRHTFETSGTHSYFCIPHERAGMVGRVVVE
jgi:plastocyanin